MTQNTDSKAANSTVSALVMTAVQTGMSYDAALARAEKEADSGASEAEVAAAAETIWRTGVAAQMRRIGAMTTPGSELFRLGEALTGTGPNKIKRYQATIGAVAKEESSSRGIVAFIASSRDKQTGKWEDQAEAARTDITRNSDIALDFAKYLSNNIGVKGWVTIEMEPMGGSGQSVRVIKNFEPIGPDRFFDDDKAEMAEDKVDEVLSKR